MQMRTLVDMILSRCQALGIKSAETGHVDASAVELRLLHVIQGLSDAYDFDTLTVIANPLFATTPGERAYALPEDFQRFLLPHDEQTTGLMLHDGTSEGHLTYCTPEDFRRSWGTTNSRPGRYTLIAGPRVLLDGPPDANGDTGFYHGTGAYIKTITPELLDGQVPMAFPSHLVEMTVAQMALDHSHATAPLLLAQGETARMRLINAQARQAQHFQSRNGRVHQYARV